MADTGGAERGRACGITGPVPGARFIQRVEMLIQLFT